MQGCRRRPGVASESAITRGCGHAAARIRAPAQAEAGSGRNEARARGRERERDGQQAFKGPGGGQGGARSTDWLRQSGRRASRSNRGLPGPVCE